MALRKIDTIHLPSLDKPSQPPDLLHKPPLSSPSPSLSSQPNPQKSPPFIDASPKPSLTPVDSALRTPLAEKPHLSDLPPKPLLKDLPPKPQLSDSPRPAPVVTEIQGSKVVVAESQSSVQQREGSPGPTGEEDNELVQGAMEMPVPLPRKINSVSVQIRSDQIDFLQIKDGEMKLSFCFR